MRKEALFLTAALFGSLLLGACAPGRVPGGDQSGTEPDAGVQTEEIEMEPIGYTVSQFDEGAASEDVMLSVTNRTQATGQKVSATVKISPMRTLPDGQEAVYYVIDWGDGTWSWQGPGFQSGSKKSAPSIPHTYKKAGTYSVRATAYSMQTDEEFGWCAPKTVRVAGEDIDYGGMIKKVAVISSEPYAKEYKAENITDSEDTMFKSKPSEEPDDALYAGYLFDTVYTLDKFEVKIPATCELFPSNIAVEYTTDAGKTWQSLPKYYYLYDYSKGRISPIMHFPNPKGATLCVDLDGIVANGIRLVSKLTSTEIEDLGKEKTLEIEEMRVYGNKRLMLYTSRGDTYDADLNNMWTIFGSAATEPVLIGGATNVSPFRTGCAMIASTEWAEWTGLKFNFTDNKEVRDAYLEQLRNIRTGPDGWSEVQDGYVWATANGPYHLNETFGAHYSLNPIFVMAVRNYLLQGNALGQYNDALELTGFMQLKNASGQTMEQKLDKAMAYMMETLDGKNGIMTIYDPKHDGTVTGMSANYWDTHRAFGYKSAYENALFYGALVAYADISEYLGAQAEAAGDAAAAGTYLARAEQYRTYAANTKKEYNKLFWNNAAGRFIGGVNVEGERLDFGYTMVNFMALAYGVADEDKAIDIYDWLDGKRIVEGDTSTGEDIYGHFKYAARTNTIDMSTKTDKNGAYYWYDHGGALPCTPGTFGGYGNQMQNGGTIFYISYYDLKARLSCLGADNAEQRFNVIMEEFHKDSLRRNSYTEHGEYVEGVIGEFPESGLVPYFFIDGFLGLNTTAEGLQIKPDLPSDLEYAGIGEYWFGNREYSIRAERGLSAPVVEKYEREDGSAVYYLRVPADKTYVVTADNRLLER